MFLLRALSETNELSKAADLTDLSATFLNEMKTKDGDYSFFEIENITNKTSDEIMMVVVFLIVNNVDLWKTNINAVFCPKNNIEKIKQLNQSEQKIWGGIHANFPKASVSDGIALITEFLKQKRSITKYSISDIRSFMTKLSKDNWSNLFSKVSPKLNKKEIIEKIHSTYFKKMDMPDGLDEFYNSL